jgi:hypothetical protein
MIGARILMSVPMEMLVVPLGIARIIMVHMIVHVHLVFWKQEPVRWIQVAKISMNATSSRLIEILHVTRWLAVKTFRAIIHVPVLMDIKEMDFIVLMSMNVINVTLAQILFLAVLIPKVLFNANVLMDMLKMSMIGAKILMSV